MSLCRLVFSLSKSLIFLLFQEGIDIFKYNGCANTKFALVWFQSHARCFSLMVIGYDLSCQTGGSIPLNIMSA